MAYVFAYLAKAPRQLAAMIETIANLFDRRGGEGIEVVIILSE